ncbi:phosphotransferase family protein [Rhizobiales bacterium]|uniref:choline/ethanolamine kinase family protein n=1 Tax=Hongsoonwoonella zoysiae TaxID=2821844 RepID=UPI001560AC5B|nr:choline/ethanolamine kinase family protein [Hongsoonwoonella zoysiae]NRG17693.1 phosphotransferase family protein [Hongsoonwoonella zoysiae]
MNSSGVFPLGEISRALSAAGLADRVGADDVSPLSGLTNRVFRVDLPEGAGVVVRLPRPETAGLIDRRRELHNAREAERVGIGPQILHADPESGVMVTRLVAGARELVPVAAGHDMLARVGAAFARLHRSGAVFEGRLDPFALISDAAARLPGLDSAWRGLVADVVALRGGDVTYGKELAPCHCDPVPGNVLERRPESHEGIKDTPFGTFSDPSGILLVDWEYSAMADPAWDLAYFALEAELCENSLVHLLEGYGGGAGMGQRVARMKPVCDCLSGLWALEQFHAGNSATDFHTYAEKRLDRANRALAALSG